MKIGVPKEIKSGENRVALTPHGAAQLISQGHRVFISAGAGRGAGFADSSYSNFGVDVLDSIEAVYDSAELIVKVKEPQASEYPLIKPHHILFTYLHLAAAPELAQALKASGAICIAYETVENTLGRLPLLAPMSEIAGRMAIQAGAFHLQSHQGGRGILLGGIPGVAPANVLILGGGVVGSHAATMAIGLGARVQIMDTSLERLRELDNHWCGRLTTHFSNPLLMAELLREADLVVGSVLSIGRSAPKLVTQEQLKQMRPGAVIVDVAIDQGGCFETSRPTTHSHPTYTVDSIIHYCVANIPSAVAHTATMGLTNASLQYIERLAEKGEGVFGFDAGLAKGLNIYRGKIVHEGVSASLGFA